MERVYLDFLGFLFVIKNYNSYILMMVDQFIKWVECILLLVQMVEVIVCVVINEFFICFGYFFQIFIDQGINFISEFFIKMCKMFKIYKIRIIFFRVLVNG